MKPVALLGLACVVVSAQSATQDSTIVGQTPQLQIGVGKQGAAAIDCSKIFDCEAVPYDPICGSDGVTYSNPCVFAIAFCSGTKDPALLFIQSAGKCSPPPKTGEVQDDTPLSDASTDSPPDVDLTTVFCSLTCKMTPDYVCGTDGITYINDCHLLSSKCDRPELEKASHGQCTDTNLNVLEVGVSITTGNAVPIAPEKCNPMCERVYDPVCGSDGVTYANPCLLEYAGCRNPNVRAFGSGKCPPNMQAARSTFNPINNNNGGESCVPSLCPYTYSPVCGSDGQTYDNLCLFANARCQDPQHALTVVHEGECDADTKLTCETMTCPTFTECHEQTEYDGTVVAYCADVCSPDRCSEREDCELVDSACYTAPCSPIAMCVPKVEDD